MSRKDFRELTFEERRKLAEQVQVHRKRAGLKQADLAELAGISRQGVSNIERGAVPQAETLRRIYEVLGVDIDPSEFSESTSQWLAIVGGIMDSLPQPNRDRAGKAAVEAVTGELVATANVSGVVETVDPHEIDLSQGNLALAASHDNTSVEEQSHPDYEDENQDPEV